MRHDSDGIARGYGTEMTECHHQFQLRYQLTYRPPGAVRRELPCQGESSEYCSVLLQAANVPVACPFAACVWATTSPRLPFPAHHSAPHHITSHHITSHHITSHHVTSRHVTSHHITSHRIASHHIASHHITSHHFTSNHITLRGPGTNLTRSPREI